MLRKPVVLLILIVAMLMSACAAPAPATTAPAADAPAAVEAKVVGVSMPTKSSSRWISDGESMVKVFTDMGYETDLQFAEDDIPNQLAQIENMVTKGVDVLIIAAIDGSTLSDILQRAHDENRIFHQAPTISLARGVRMLRLALWDEQQKRMIGFGDLRALQRA